jgi:thioredoxin 1
MTAKAVTDATFEADVLQSDRPVVVDFWAPWCGPCRQISPLLDEIAAQHAEISVVKLNTDENPQVTARYGIIGLPSVAVYTRGELVKMITGAKPKPALLRELSDWLD